MFIMYGEKEPMTHQALLNLTLSDKENSCLLLITYLYFHVFWIVSRLQPFLYMNHTIWVTESKPSTLMKIRRKSCLFGKIDNYFFYPYVSFYNESCNIWFIPYDSYNGELCPRKHFYTLIFTKIHVYSRLFMIFLP